MANALILLHLCNIEFVVTPFAIVCFYKIIQSIVLYDRYKLFSLPMVGGTKRKMVLLVGGMLEVHTINLNIYLFHLSLDGVEVKLDRAGQIIV